MKRIGATLLVLVFILGYDLVPCAQMNNILSITGQAASSNSDGRINDLPEIKRPTNYQKNKAYIEANQISPELSESLDYFSWLTAKAFISGESSNSMYSPLSLYIPLSLVATGANSQTYSEMASVLGINQEITKFCGDMGKLYRRSYISSKASTLKIANSLWFQNGMKFKKSFLNNATDNYYSTIHKVDFTKKSAGQQMSGWVAENTNNLLNPSIKPSTDTKLAIMNTVYYKDSWYDPFNANFTKPQPFYLNDGSTVTCDFMSNTYYGGQYFETNQFSGTSISLNAGGKMYVMLPKKGVGIDAILSNKAAIQSIIDGKLHESAIVNLKIPKFSFSTSYKDIIEKLESLGINQAFGSGADFSKISSTPLFISNIIQNTKISVHEAGIEAAAFTLIEQNDSAPDYGDIKTVDLTLSRPFLFIITSDFGAPLFIGVCNNPLAE